MKTIKTLLACLVLTGLMATVHAQQKDKIPHQTEEEFQNLLPITGTVETMGGNFELDHSFPAPGEADKIYDLMDHQRATQLYLWGMPIVGMTRWHLGYVRNYENYDYNKIVAVKTFNERRGVLTANETTDYFWGFGNTRKSAVILEIPKGIAVGMICDMWQQSPGDYGVFGPNNGNGDLVAVVGPNTPADMVPERNDDLRIMEIGTDQCYWLFRLIGTTEEVKAFTNNLKIYNYGEKPTPVDIVPGEDKLTVEYQPRGLAYWEMLHTAINREVVQDRDRFFMYWLRQLGIEKGKPFNPSERQKKILIDAAETGELMAKSLVYNERMDGVLRQNNWRMNLGGAWGDGNKYTNRMKYWDAIDPRTRYTYEAITTSPAMTMPKPGKAQLYIGKFEDEDGQRLKGGNNYVIRIEKDVPANLFWSIVIYDADTRCIIDNRSGAAGGKATVGSKTKGLKTNADGSHYMLLGPDAPPKGWEANHVQTLPGRGWFPYMRMYGAEESAFNDEYKFPTVKKVKNFSEYITHTSKTKPIPVTAENFAQAETAWNMRNWDKLRTGPGIFHYRDVTPTGPEAPTVRMNWDTLYSNRVVTVSDDHEFSVTLPESDLYIAVQVIDENGFSPYYIYEKGVEHKLKVDTDHAWVLFRTELKDRHSKEALAATHAAQDQIVISGIMEDVRYVMPNYDQDQLEKLRKEYKEEFLKAGIDLVYAKGPGEEEDQHLLDISHAAGFGGYPPEEGRSNIYSMSDNQPGDTCLAVTFDDPKSAFFTSFTVYDADGYLIDANSHIRSDRWTPNDDGTITIHFNCGDDAVNNLSSNGETFNYTVRYYGVSREVMDGTIRPLKPEPVQ